ncbi:DUF4911 domain-containing protein [Desulfogranum mediterraneum]|uniref:DUF4911 domain-containing protein n=1 Tax=Desulfogranum mediterraneum TaxID=160661 RepID=UPI00041BC53D|nr:DUF4911 domain-containing protein [Desulfogranum mediterraneum]
MDSYSFFLRIRKEKIGWLKFILEGYDNMATISTISVSDGLVRIWTTGAALGEVFALLAALAGELSPYPAPADSPSLS